MISVCINPLSASGQHFEMAHVEESISKIVHCFQYILPALEAGGITLIYDESVERRGLLFDGAGIISEVNHLSNKDIKRQWFLYTKNHAVRANSVLRTVTVSAPAVADVVLIGEISEQLMDEAAKWLSFGGSPLNEESDLEVASDDPIHNLTVPNSFDLQTFRRWWPVYAASGKHRRTGYFRDGEWISPMPLGEREAQEALMTSVQIGSDRYAYYKGRYYRFPRTHIDHDIFHGFQIERQEVPQSALEDIED